MSLFSRRGFLHGTCSCSALALASCATTLPEGRVPPGYRPALASAEGDLWRVVDKAEEDVKRSRFRMRDENLNQYLQTIACRLSQDRCSDIRVYLMRVPHFNASMAPNGMMQIWSGLLLRVKNEAQLAAIVGHEIGHYIERHTLEKWLNLKARADFNVFLSLGLALAGVPAVGDLITLATILSLFAYSREQEREADAVGLDLMAAAGYEPIEASKVWQQLIAEQEADPNKKERNVFIATHPAPKERLENLRIQAAGIATGASTTNAEIYRDRMRLVRGLLLEDELMLRQYERSLVVLQHLTESYGDDAEIAFYLGEVYRLRDGEGDPERARQKYEQSIASGAPPPQVYRSLGLLHLHADEPKAASAAFRRYLEMVPHAPDRAIIRSYIQVGG